MSHANVLKLKLCSFYFSFFNQICSHEAMQTLAQTAGEATEPTLTELMKTMYDGASARQLMYADT